MGVVLGVNRSHSHGNCLKLPQVFAAPFQELRWGMIRSGSAWLQEPRMEPTAVHKLGNSFAKLTFTFSKYIHVVLRN